MPVVKKTKAKKPVTKKPAKKTLKKVCRTVIKTKGVKADRTLKKGYKYKKGGGVVKVKPKAATKKTTKKKVGK